MKKLIAVLWLLIAGCSKTDQPVVFQLTDMHVKTGNSFSYLVTNYPPTETDTAVFKIVSQSTAGTDSTVYKTQTSISGAVVDSGTIVQTSNSITFNGANGLQTFAGSGLFDGWKLSFPITYTSSWLGNGANIQVLTTGQNYTLQGIAYQHVYTLARTTITPGGQVTDTLRIAIGKGIIEWNSFPLAGYHIQ